MSHKVFGKEHAQVPVTFNALNLFTYWKHTFGSPDPQETNQTNQIQTK